MSQKEPLFEIENCLGMCDSCGEKAEKAEDNHIISAFRTGHGMSLCTKCLNKLSGMLDKHLEKKGW